MNTFVASTAILDLPSEAKATSDRIGWYIRHSGSNESLKIAASGYHQSAWFVQDFLQPRLRFRSERTQNSIISIGRIAEDWELSKPILLVVEQAEDGEYVVSDSFSTVYGNGSDRDSAIADYYGSLIDYHECLAEHSTENDLAATALARLQHFLRKVRR